MAAEAPSWADQWGSGGIGAMGDANDVKTQKEDESKKKTNSAGLGKAKAVAMAGAQKIKGGPTAGFKWIKNQCSKKKSTSNTNNQ